MDRVRLVDVRDDALSLDEVVAAVADPAAGATCVFIGTVRDHDGGRGVTELSYTAHPTVLERLREVAARVAADEDVLAVAAVHRTGDLVVGDLAVVVAASAAHRPEAFAAGRRLIEELKSDVPIWKDQQYVDGDRAWM